VAGDVVVDAGNQLALAAALMQAAHIKEEFCQAMQTLWRLGHVLQAADAADMIHFLVQAIAEGQRFRAVQQRCSHGVRYGVRLTAGLLPGHAGKQALLLLKIQIALAGHEQFVEPVEAVHHAEPLFAEIRHLCRGGGGVMGDQQQLARNGIAPAELLQQALACLGELVPGYRRIHQAYGHQSVMFFQNRLSVFDHTAEQLPAFRPAALADEQERAGSHPGHEQGKELPHQALDKAHIMVMSGATSYATAMKEIVDELAEHQAYVRYPTGHTDTLEVAVLRAVRTGTAQASGNMSISTMEQYGWDIVLTSAHLGARYGDGGPNPGNHFWWQGRFFSRSGKDPRFPSFIESTGYGTGEGLCGWNCRHSFGPGDGVHNPWTKYDAEENKRAYDLSQMQRKKERNIRSQTKKVEAFKEAVAAAQSDDVRKVMQEALKEEQGKLTSLRKDYSNFCDDNGLKRQAFRLQVAKAKQQDAERSFYTQPSQPPVNTGLTENSKDGTIDIEVDEMTPCLRKNSTGELVDTTVRSISPTRATCKGWEFDWTKPERDGYQVFALRVKGERKIQGMIAMKDDPGNYAMKIDIVEAAPQNNPHNPLNTSGTKEYNGVGGHLFAEACRQSFEKGYGGFVHFVAKTNLIPHYAKTLGAELLNSRDRIMAIDGPAALALVKRYYGGGK